MDISPPPCVSKEESDILDCYFFTSGNVNLMIMMMMVITGKVIIHRNYERDDEDVYHCDGNISELEVNGTNDDWQIALIRILYLYQSVELNYQQIC